ncbi:hypothetical protein H0O02_02920 [Candidatus Micrarchaeota archaeon]|nr:hypothetical protein [Candidatus Micrarchaeota archaeon]
MDRIIGSLMFLLLAGMVYSQGPVLQISDYSVVPEKLYPDATGQLQVTVRNSGDETASGTTIYYNYKLDERWDTYVGDIGAGSDAITSIPFKVPSSVTSGVIVIRLDMYYRDEDNGATKTSSVSIPLTISQHQILEVNTISLERDSVSKGESFGVELEMKNTGGTMKNVVISTPADSSFTLKGTTQQRVGDIPSNSSINVSVDLMSSSSTETGKYTVPLEITYQDSLQNEITETAYIGPVNVVEPSTQYRIYFEPLSGTEIGSQAQYKLSIENLGTEARALTVTIEGSSVFTPIGPANIYFDDIAPGETQTKMITLGVDSDTSSGYYVLPISIDSNGEIFVQEVGIVVEATPAITLTSEISSETTSAASGTPSESSTGTSGNFASMGNLQVTVKIANSGNTPIRSVYAVAESTDEIRVTDSPDKFIGTLNVDDFGTFQTTVMMTGTCTEGCKLPITITFKDENNVEHTFHKEVEVDGSAGAGSTAAAGMRADRGPLGFIPSIFGINVLYIVGVVALGVLGYFGYKKWKKGKAEGKK